MGGGPGRQGAPDQLPNFFTTLHRRLNMLWWLKKVVNFLGEEKCTSREKILGMRMRKGPPPYVGMGPPEWLIRLCSFSEWWLNECLMNCMSAFIRVVCSTRHTSLVFCSHMWNQSLSLCALSVSSGLLCIFIAFVRLFCNLFLN